MGQYGERGKRETATIFGQTIVALIAIPFALIGLAICVVCVITFPIGLLGFPFAIGFFVPMMVWLGWIGNRGTDIRYGKAVEKFMRGQHVNEDEIIHAVNHLMESKRESDRQLGLLAREELERNRQKARSSN